MYQPPPIGSETTASTSPAPVMLASARLASITAAGSAAAEGGVCAVAQPAEKPLIINAAIAIRIVSRLCVAQRPRNQLVQLAMDAIVGRKELAALHGPLATAEVGDEAARFLHQQHARSDVPR